MNRRNLSKFVLKEKKEEYLRNFSERLSGLSEKVSVILVHPKYQGNIGAIARLLRNSGLKDLRLVSPPAIENEAIYRAMYGKEILLNAPVFETLEEATKGFSVIAGTSSAPTFSDRKFLRLPTDPEDFWKTALDSGEKIALVFGREDDGLRNEEIELCNAFIYIPADPDYPVFNLSHAVSIILYEMLKQLPESRPEMTDPVLPEDFEHLMESFNELLDLSGYPVYKKQNAEIMAKRIANRANLTESEFYKIMGVLRYLKYMVGENRRIETEGNSENGER